MCDCNLNQLFRVYSQMGQIFFGQSLYRQFMQCYQIAESIAWKDKDTLNAIICHEKQGLAYDAILKPDSSILVIEQTSQLFTSSGHPKDAAIALGSAARTLLNMGQVEKAKRYMSIYESESGLFNSEGEIEKGREAL